MHSILSLYKVRIYDIYSVVWVAKNQMLDEVLKTITNNALCQAVVQR